MTKYSAIAAALLVSTNVSAQPLNARSHPAASVRSVALPHGAVLDNIIGRVQMDALIDTIVATGGPAPSAVNPGAMHRGLAYAAVDAAKVRSRS